MCYHVDRLTISLGAAANQKYFKYHTYFDAKWQLCMDNTSGMCKCCLDQSSF